ncbi:MAG: hypothetical protein RCG15_00380 [Candidatus Rickettsia vulgarisii]
MLTKKKLHLINKVKIATDTPQPSVFNNLAFKGSKSSGANDGGVYTDKDGNLSMIKRESNFSKNISEFLGSQIFQELSPDSGAKVSLIAPDYLNKELNQKNGIQNDGSEIYVKSDYIKNYSADMYVDMDKHMSEKTRPSRLFRKEDNLQRLGRPLFASSRKLLNRAFKEIPYQNFEKIAPASLVIGDFDMHIGNIGVIRDSVSTSTKPKLVRIDFAGSLDKLEKNIHPHSWSRHLPLLGPTNHFREFPSSLKNNDIFANSLLETSKIDLDKTIDKSFAELSKYYNDQALIKWAKMAMPSKFKNIPAGQIKIEDIKDTFKETMKERQKSAKEYGLQIKLGLITKKGRINGPKLKELIQEHPDYFNDLVNKKRRLKLRGNTRSKIGHLFFSTKKLLLKEVRKTLQEESKGKKTNKISHTSIKKTPKKIEKNPTANNVNTNQVSIPQPLQESLATIKNGIKKHIEPPVTKSNEDLIKIAENLSKNLKNKDNIIRKSLINETLKDNLTPKEQISILKHLLNIEETKITDPASKASATKGNVATKVFIFDKIADLNQKIQQNDIVKNKKPAVKGFIVKSLS